uniref:Uncharacterized protein n=1 Tax=Anguilla anguilla TaxID=7936 RepID=A0A0E9RLZ2_ANGAN
MYIYLYIFISILISRLKVQHTFQIKMKRNDTHSDTILSECSL